MTDVEVACIPGALIPSDPPATWDPGTASRSRVWPALCPRGPPREVPSSTARPDRQALLPVRTAVTKRTGHRYAHGCASRGCCLSWRFPRGRATAGKFSPVAAPGKASDGDPNSPMTRTRSLSPIGRRCRASTPPPISATNRGTLPVFARKATNSTEAEEDPAGDRRARQRGKGRPGRAGEGRTAALCPSDGSVRPCAPGHARDVRVGGRVHAVRTCAHSYMPVFACALTHAHACAHMHMPHHALTARPGRAWGAGVRGPPAAAHPPGRPSRCICSR